MIRKPDHCGRCGQRGRRRSMELLRYSGIYACRDCNNKSGGYATLLNYRRREKAIAILADFPTIGKLKINLLHPLLQQSAIDENGRFTVVGNLRSFGFVARNYGLIIRGVEVLEDRRDILREEIDSMIGERLSVLLYPGLSQISAVRRLVERSNHPVIVLADGDAAVSWKNEIPRVLTISEAELPMQPRRDMGAPAIAGAPAH